MRAERKEGVKKEGGRGKKAGERDSQNKGLKGEVDKKTQCTDFGWV